MEWVPCCYSLDLECPPKVHVLKTWSPAHGAMGGAGTTRWRNTVIGGISLKGILGPQPLPLSLSLPSCHETSSFVPPCTPTMVCFPTTCTPAMVCFPTTCTPAMVCFPTTGPNRQSQASMHKTLWQCKPKQTFLLYGLETILMVSSILSWWKADWYTSKYQLSLFPLLDVRTLFSSIASQLWFEGWEASPDTEVATPGVAMYLLDQSGPDQQCHVPKPEDDIR
jgi:hypothetical protein